MSDRTNVSGPAMHKLVVLSVVSLSVSVAIGSLAASAAAQPLATLTGDHITLSSPVAFESGGDVITAEGMRVLDAVASVLQQHPELDVEIGVHTDSTGSSAFNQALTDRRAAAVAAYLSRRGVMARRMRAVGYGETRPIDSNRTETGRERNRRVDFTVHAR